MDRLSALERALLLLPLAGGMVFGLSPLLVPQSFALATGYSGDDPLVARYAGAATFGYAVALVPGIRDGLWRPLRLVVVAVLVFNLASLYACAAEIVAGVARPVVFLILVTSVLLVAIGGWLLARHDVPPEEKQDVSDWVLFLLLVLTIGATAFGLLPLLGPTQFARYFGLVGTDTFLFRQAGAATLGYAAMGLLEMRSGRWDEIRLPAAMGLAFNGASFLASLLALLGDDASSLVVIVTPASLGATVAFAAALARRGR